MEGVLTQEVVGAVGLGEQVEMAVVAEREVEGAGVGAAAGAEGLAVVIVGAPAEATVAVVRGEGDDAARAVGAVEGARAGGEDEVVVGVDDGGDVVFVWFGGAGRVGDEERDEILAREKDFNLKLVFAEKTGSYMADVKVVVLNTKGQTVLEANSTGPFFLAKLPAGNYRLKVTGNGRAQEAMMAVPAKGRQGRTFIW